MEDGVEVVLNNQKPYVIKGEPNSLTLEQDYVFDLERDDLAELGMSDTIGFDVDSGANIYFWNVGTSENLIFKFDKNGKFVSSFGRKGQGPGEIDVPNHFWIDGLDTINVSNPTKKKLILYNTDGELIKEIPFVSRTIIAVQLVNENILVLNRNILLKTGYSQLPIVLCNSDSEEIKTLYQGQKIAHLVRAKKVNGLRAYYNIYTWNMLQGHTIWGISQAHICVANGENDYEFLIYDLEGNLVRKIRKEYNPVEVPEQLKEQVMKILDQPRFSSRNIKEKIYFPDNMPAFQYFFMDDESRLYVMTCEKGQGPKDYVYDIFNPDGAYIGRTAIGNIRMSELSLQPFPLQVRAKNKRLYYFRSKESGYQELVVYKMIWQ